MKVTSERLTGSASARRTAATARSSAAADAFAEALGGASAGPGQPATPVTAASPIESLLTAQEMPGGTVSRRRAAKRGSDILDQLERLRLGLITGAIPRRDLQRLVEMLAKQRENIADPGLISVIDEIDLRAQVEIAKHFHHS